MNRQEVLSAIKSYFLVSELVCDHVYDKFGERAWDFLDTDYLHALLIIRRDIIRLPMWCTSRTQKQRGLRCNRCQIVKSKNTPYLSAHVLGKAGDFTITGMSASVAREKIKANAHLLTCKVRLEKWDSTGQEISWLHIDVIDNPQNPKVYEFKA